MNTTRRGFIAALCAPALAAVGCKLNGERDSVDTHVVSVRAFRIVDGQLQWTSFAATRPTPDALRRLFKV